MLSLFLTNESNKEQVPVGLSVSACGIALHSSVLHIASWSGRGRVSRMSMHVVGYMTYRRPHFIQLLKIDMVTTILHSDCHVFTGDRGTLFSQSCLAKM